jgi:hypothetical protein
VGFEVAAMKAPHPVLADVREDDRRAVEQFHPNNALFRLPARLLTLYSSAAIPTLAPSCNHLHPPHILCFEGLGVLKVGPAATLVLRLPVHDLAVLTISPCPAWKASRRRQRPRGLGVCKARGHHDATPTAALKHGLLGLATVLHGPRHNSSPVFGRH